MATGSDLRWPDRDKVTDLGSLVTTWSHVVPRPTELERSARRPRPGEPGRVPATRRPAPPAPATRPGAASAGGTVASHRRQVGA
jgi:hypothetical protein